MKSLNNPKMTSPYGDRPSPINGGAPEHHNGVDLIDSKGDATVYAIADGEVTFDHDDYKEWQRWDGNSNSSLGNFIIIKHCLKEKNVYVRYGHLTENVVKKGQMVKQGEKVGAYGNVGMAKGAP